MLRKYIDMGAKGFGEHKPGIAFDDPRNMAVFAACAEAGLPVLFHLDNQRNTDKPGLPGLEKVLQQNPKCTFIGHGPGWWASISGNLAQNELAGYPKGKVSPGGAIDRLMSKYPNIYGDLSAGSGANSISRDLKFGREFLIRRADRIMFGTDFLAPKQPVPQFELFEQQLQLEKEQLAQKEMEDVRNKETELMKADLDAQIEREKLDSKERVEDTKAAIDLQELEMRNERDAEKNYTELVKTVRESREKE